jgi:hypothetical protein
MRTYRCRGSSFGRPGHEPLVPPTSACQSSPGRHKTLNLDHFRYVTDLVGDIRDARNEVWGGWGTGRALNRRAFPARMSWTGPARRGTRPTRRAPPRRPEHTAPHDKADPRRRTSRELLRSGRPLRRAERLVGSLRILIDCPGSLIASCRRLPTPRLPPPARVAAHDDG